MVEPDVIAEDPELHAKFVAATEAAAVRAYTELLEGLEKQVRRRRAGHAAPQAGPAGRPRGAAERHRDAHRGYRQLPGLAALRRDARLRTRRHRDPRAGRRRACANCSAVAPNVFADFEITTLPGRHRGRVVAAGQRGLGPGARVDGVVSQHGAPSGLGPARPAGRLLTAMVTPVRGRPGARSRCGRRAGQASGRRAAQRRAGDQRDHRGGADHQRMRRRRIWSAPWSTRSATGRRSSPASAPSTPRTRSTWPSRRPRPARTALLVVTPYYSRPPQPGLLRISARWPMRPSCRCCCTTFRHRTGTPISHETLIALAGHERIVGGQGRQG